MIETPVRRNPLDEIAVAGLVLGALVVGTLPALAVAVFIGTVLARP